MKDKESQIGSIDLDQVLSPQTRRWIRQQCERDGTTPLNWVADLILREYMANVPMPKDDG